MRCQGEIGELTPAKCPRRAFALDNSRVTALCSPQRSAIRDCPRTALRFSTALRSSEQVSVLRNYPHEIGNTNCKN